MTANLTRGEVDIKLGGADYILRPSFEAIVAFEGVTGKGLLRLAREAIAGDLTLTETAVVATECIRAWGRAIGDDLNANVHPDRIKEMIVESEGGYAKVLGTVSGVLSGAVTGAYTSSGEVNATGIKPKKTMTPVAE